MQRVYPSQKKKTKAREKARHDNCQTHWLESPFTRRKRRNESRKRKPLLGLDEVLQDDEECKKITEEYTAICSSRDTATWERRTVPEKGHAVAVKVVGPKKGARSLESRGGRARSAKRCPTPQALDFVTQRSKYRSR